MTMEQLEARLAQVEQAVAELRAESAARRVASLLSLTPTPMTPEMIEDHKAMEQFGRYFRRTGTCPPPDWNPGDPIPEPEHWS